MGIPINITGLNQFIPNIPEGKVILIQSNMDPIATIFTQNLAVFARKQGMDVVYITSRTRQEVCEQIEYYQKEETDGINVVEERSYRRWKEFVTPNSVVVLDSFSYLILDIPFGEVKNILEDFLKTCQQMNSIVILTMEQGMLLHQIEIAAGHLADGILHFLSKDTSKGIARFIRIVKWMKGKSFDENIYYTFDGQRMNIDLRARVT